MREKEEYLFGVEYVDLKRNGFEDVMDRVKVMEFWYIWEFINEYFQFFNFE